jgi:hypothetical protein
MYEFYRVKFEDFSLDIIIDLDKEMTSTKNKLIRLQIEKAVQEKYYYKVKRKYNSDEIKEIYGLELDYDNLDQIISYIWHQDHTSYPVPIDISEQSKCYGCRYNCPGQKDHMDIDGCLYSNSESE